MKHSMHVRLALLVLGCLIFGIEARHGGSGCHCRPVTGPVGPTGAIGPSVTGATGDTGPTGPCCVKSPIVASFYTLKDVLIGVSGSNNPYPISLDQTAVSSPGITLDDATHTTFRVAQGGYYRISYVLSPWLEQKTVPQGGFAFIAENGNAIKTTGTVFIREGAGSSASSVTGQSIVKLRPGADYSLLIAAYNVGQTSFLRTNGFGEITSAQLMIEFIG